jgi:hypothetical protein
MDNHRIGLVGPAETINKRITFLNGGDFEDTYKNVLDIIIEIPNSRLYLLISLISLCIIFYILSFYFIYRKYTKNQKKVQD